MANQHVVYRGHNEWAVLRENSNRDSVVVKGQDNAFDIARQTAMNQGGEVFIHGRDGKIRGRNTYGNDPYPPKG